MSQLNEKQKKFVDEYLKDLNGTQAALRAGYAESSSRHRASALLARDDVQDRIQEQLSKIEKKNIATVEDVLEFLSQSLFEELDEEVLMTIGTGEGTSQIAKARKKISMKDRLKAAELIGKYNAMWTDKTEVNHTGQVQFIDDLEGDLDEQED